MNVQELLGPKANWELQKLEQQWQQSKLEGRKSPGGVIKFLGSRITVPGFEPGSDTYLLCDFYRKIS